MRLTTHSALETRSLAERLAAEAAAGDRIALHGPLGAGKTEFTKGFARGLGVTEVVISPSFTLMAEYRGRLPLFHLDLFRLSGRDEAYDGGLLDERQGEGVTVIEWAERLDRSVDPERIEVALVAAGEPDDRAIELVDRSGVYARYLRAATGWAEATRP